MNRTIVETVMGGVVLVIAGFFLAFAYSSAQVRTVSGYEVMAKFNHAEGIREGGDVRISGIKVGTILSESLDPQTFLSIDKSIKLPSDTIAEIASSSLLGDNVMSLVPGNDDDHLIPPNGQIIQTQSPISFADILKQAAMSLTGGSKPADSSGASAGGGGGGGQSQDKP
jgi:phospholipid/cholesterol/gamma-HCH transport system substrate-binding protein